LVLPNRTLRDHATGVQEHSRLPTARATIDDVVKGEQLFTRAIDQLERMRVEEALRLFVRAEQAGYDPDSCAAGRWDCHMLLGDFEAAWRESDSIAQRGNPDPHRFWNGQPFANRHVLIRCLHGLGDTLQFIRYVPLLREQARSVAIEAQPTLKSLLEHARIADQVITWGEPEPPWDQQIEIIELPRIFRTTVKSIPNHAPYINLRSAREADANRRKRPLRVGLVWASSTYNPQRSIPLRALSELFSLPQVSFFSLQVGPQQAELEPWSRQIPNLYSGSPCILPMAETVQAMDLVITVDTMMAHLAGAIARPVWTLLPYQSDWRWMLHREDSPWYPTMRLFRQKCPGDWGSVVRQLKRALQMLIRNAALEARPACRPFPHDPVPAPEAQEA
jgi:hypothetical protein